MFKLIRTNRKKNCAKGLLFYRDSRPGTTLEPEIFLFMFFYFLLNILYFCIMLFNTTHKDPEQRQLIDDLVGAPFNLWKKIQMGGVGSGRMIIEEVSPSL